MMNLSKEIRIGIVIAAGFIILIFGLKYLKGLEVFSKGTTYYVIYDDVTGLNQGSPVIFQGLKIGSVRDLELHPTRNGKILVTCLLTENIGLSVDTKAQLFSLDLLGAKGVNLLQGKSPKMHLPNDTILQDFERSFKDQMATEIAPLKDKLESVMIRFDTLLVFANKLMNPNNPQGLTQGFQDFSQSMSNFKSISSSLNAQLSDGGSLDVSLQNLENITSTFNAKSESLGRIIVNLDTTTTQLSRSDLAQTMAKFNLVLNDARALLDSINQGKGSVGMLMTDKTLYYNLLASTENLDRLLLDVKQNPKRYVSFSAFDFGKKVYSAPQNTVASEKKTDFHVLIAQSDSILPLKSKIIKGQVVKEMVWKNKYVYLLGESKSFIQIDSLFESVKVEFPKAEVVATTNGVQVPLKDVLSF